MKTDKVTELRTATGAHVETFKGFVPLEIKEFITIEKTGHSRTYRVKSKEWFYDQTRNVLKLKIIVK